MFRAALRPLRPLAPLLGALLGLGCITINLPTGAVEPLVETVIDGDEDARTKILVIEVDGVIRETPETTGFLGTLQESTVGRVREELDRAREDERVAAVLLRVNSPGGTVTGSDLLHREIQRFKADRGVPVVAQLMAVAASGGYYVALAADEIRAEPTTVTGSIGVIFTSINVAGLMEKLGVEDQTLTSGEFKDAGSLLRRMTPDERAQLQSVLDDLYGRFVEVVRSGRSDLSDEQVAQLADGRIFSAAQALEAGLIDALGSVDDALERLRELSGARNAKVVTYHRPREYASNYYSRPPSRRGVDLTAWTEPLGLRGPAFLYLWAPGQGAR